MGLFLEKFIKNDVVINVVTAIIFAFLHLFKMHLNIYGLIFYGLVYGMLGYSCGYYYRKTSNIVLSMLIHFIWNLCMFAGIVLRNMLWMKTKINWVWWMENNFQFANFPFERGEILFSKGFFDIRKLQDKAKTSYTISTRRPRFDYE